MKITIPVCTWAMRLFWLDWLFEYERYRFGFQYHTPWIHMESVSFIGVALSFLFISLRRDWILSFKL